MPRLTFVHSPADDPSVDPEWNLFADGAQTLFSVQDGREWGGRYYVGSHGPTLENVEWAEHHGEFRRLAAAQAEARRLYLASVSVDA